MSYQAFQKPLNYFNSIKVQLKLKERIDQLRQDYSFQFHKGTIKTRYLLPLKGRPANFNSIKVQLKPPMVFFFCSPCCISIP